MSHRDSDSKRRHSKFDREPSPKRYRRDGKQERERDRNRVTSDRVDQSQRNPPLPHHHSRRESLDAAPKKSNSNGHHDPPKHFSQPPRSRSYYQVGRSNGQREAGEKSKENNERVEPGQSRELREEKSQVKLDDNLQKRNGFSERKDDPPPTLRKRRAFREKKIPVDSTNANPPALVAVKSSQTDHLPERNERKEERSSNPHHLDRPEKQITEDRALNKSEARRDGFSSRGRYGGSGGISNYRGRDKFNGRQGYHPFKTRVEKWKHDLYQEVNKDPIPKNEDDQIAKLEALLAS
ncbi:DEAD-box ATP-dependent RNA helicase 42 isoform X2 [Cajanus cajan]|uniref:DEAD-box ATP-dependent RNA helicase 42 isoform X2 n=1 Tax=Cajanus cajan TaxID=3821 RepID=UPI00098DAD31|nr:DEAD-box ATP-dependent RNA helicase 42 isoform X2 [Cajanus cajan]